MAKYYVLMGDIIGSSRSDNPKRLRKDFMQVISACNKKFKREILSPYTVTLGDEFQGIAASLQAMIEAVFYMEEKILYEGLSFKIRYVSVYGEIETAINRLKAHTMLGPGLTRAREILTDKRRGVPRFRFEFPDPYLTEQFNRLFLVFDGLTRRWSPEDGRLILDMLASPHNEEVGKLHDKNRTQIWKRRRNLLIEEVRALKETIRALSHQQTASNI